MARPDGEGQMTTPTERTRAVVYLPEAVMDLAPYLSRSNGDMVKVPRELIERLCAWLLHYPLASELDQTAEAMPHLWGPVQRGDGNDRNS